MALVANRRENKLMVSNLPKKLDQIVFWKCCCKLGDTHLTALNMFNIRSIQLYGIN